MTAKHFLRISTHSSSPQLLYISQVYTQQVKYESDHIMGFTVVIKTVIEKLTKCTPLMVTAGNTMLSTYPEKLLYIFYRSVNMSKSLHPYDTVTPITKDKLFSPRGVNLSCYIRSCGILKIPLPREFCLTLAFLLWDTANTLLN